MSRNTRPEQVFNVADTNGRRSDLVAAYRDYANELDFLNQLGMPWATWPESLAQYQFYKDIIALPTSPFENTSKFDDFESQLDALGLRDDFESKDPSAFATPEGQKLMENLDTNIEKRARHYTSVLVRIGFATADRKLTAAGKALLDTDLVDPDPLEQILFDHKTELLLCRRLCSLRIWSKDGREYFSPMSFVLAALAENGSCQFSKLLRMAHLLTPELGKWFSTKFDISEVNSIDFSEFAAEVNGMVIGLKDDAELNAMADSEFHAQFKNQKSNSQRPVYKRFMQLLDNFVQAPSPSSFKSFMDAYAKDKAAINKAFGHGTAIFNIAGKASRDMSLFLAKNGRHPFITARAGERRGVYLSAFASSKRSDSVREYAGEMGKVINAANICCNDNDVCTFVIPDLWREIDERVGFKDLVYGTGDYKSYECGRDPLFGENRSLCQIFGIDREEAEAIAEGIIAKHGSRENMKLAHQLAREAAFARSVRNRFSVSHVIELLRMSQDRSNDKAVIKAVGGNCDMPTAFEYLVALAVWNLYDQEFSLLAAINLYTNADGLPVRFASGGHGDITCDFPTEKMLVEATLMNRHSQQSGEMGPVIKHSVQNKAAALAEGKAARTVFVAPEIDGQMTVPAWDAAANGHFKDGNGNDIGGVDISAMTVEDLCQALEEKQQPQAARDQ